MTLEQELTFDELLALEERAERARLHARAVFWRIYLASIVVIVAALILF